MQIKGLRLVGFKSFVEPAELVISAGLTGVLGPNGCGKSNLLEALRWVMGETSTKSMRASAMDDVIFSGTQILSGVQGRPARNAAEVTIFLDNTARTAPAEFNDSDQIEVTRRIERESGSSYRINGREARARDVKLLFEDAATGARSHALVRQGQIGQIINAKPEARRRILEDAAGIAGLHSRRHEAELRLTAAENNLARLADLVGQLSGQRRSLERQARQARRYKGLSGEIRRAEAIQLHLAWQAACGGVEAEEQGLQDRLREVASTTATEAAARVERERLAETLQPLREEEARRAAGLQRLGIEHKTLEREAANVEAGRRELEARLAQTRHDIAREKTSIGEARRVLERLAGEETHLREAADGEGEEAEARARTEEMAARLEAGEPALAKVTSELADLKASARNLETALGDISGRVVRLVEEKDRLTLSLSDLAAAGSGDLGALARERDAARQRLTDAEAADHAADRCAAEARQAEHQRHVARNEASLRVREIETEIETLRGLLAPSDGGDWPAILEQVRVAPGLETALGAALGDDLEAPSDPRAPLHWGLAEPASDDPALPAGAEPFGTRVEAPAELARRLAQVGLVDRADGPAMQHRLRAGQRLVSREGDLWRWDGLTATAEAPSPAGQRLEGRNRLAAGMARLEAVRAEAARLAEQHNAAMAKTRQAETALSEAREASRMAQAALDAAQSALADAEHAGAEHQRRESALIEAAERTGAALTEAKARQAEIRTAIAKLDAVDELESRLDKRRQTIADLHTTYLDARARLAGLERERELRAERLSRIDEDRERWAEHARSAEEQIEALAVRLEAGEKELSACAALPGQIEARRAMLISEIAHADAARGEAADRLAAAENELRARDAALRDVQAALVGAREGRARVEARLEAARERRSEQARTIRETLECAPEACLAIVGLDAAGAGNGGVPELPPLDQVERKLVKLRAERERLGGVNLRAEEELTTLAAELDGMEAERADLEEAIARLRQGIVKLNRKGRQRLLDAFETVNGHFKRLFAVLFGGGEAELRLIESDDPLASGLELIARPPGKKPAVLSLLSGGEQALTALSLIFAVFLTNPSPICVLDEVDAPLDDANVDRFCTMMEEMARETDTRFLVITHHPMTMARMSRLFGVTMAEKGVSQLVSVDLAASHELREAS